MLNDEHFMRLALAEAKKGLGRTSPNPMVGAVVVKNNKILATGFHHHCGGDHAEIDAFKKIGTKAKGSKLYVTLEPCRHYGRTPPCVDQIIKRGIKEVVVAMKDPNPLTNGKSIKILKKAGVKVKVGVLEKEARWVNEAFIKHMTKGFPFVVTKTAQTLDGKIATRTGESKWITQDATREFARKIRDQFDAILVGVDTVLKDDPRLNGYHKKTLKKIILDSTGKTPLKARLFHKISSKQCILATTKKISSQKIKIFRNKDVDVLVCPQKDGGVDLKWLFKELAKKEITSILIEGGAQTIGSALKNNLVDKMHVYIAPKILGDQNAKSAIAGLNIRNLSKAISLKDVSLRTIDQDIWIEGYVHRHR